MYGGNARSDETPPDYRTAGLIGSMPFPQLHYPFESKELFDQDLNTG